MSLYNNKYRVESTRLSGWDYSSNCIYFITMVTQHRVYSLGEIVAADIPVMQLSDFGKIVDTEWQKSFEIRNELFLDEYIIMPNHLHAIVIINNNESMTVDEPVADVETHGRRRRDARPCVSTSVQSNITIPIISSFTQIHITSFLAGFKSAVNTKIDDYIDINDLNIPKYNRKNHFFQPDFHDHIIRNDNELFRIRQYIKNNVQNRVSDSLNNQGGLSID